MVDRNMDAFENFYKNKTVLVTGHTGFKGGWLTAWLKSLGANVVGLSLPPDSTPNLFEVAQIDKGMISVLGDIRDSETLYGVIRKHNPEIIFHMAAQALVRLSYQTPVETFDTNVMGTVRLLDAVRRHPSARVVINVTSDKCYDNTEGGYSFRESDPKGGHDPYSASKGCAELVTEAFRHSFFHSAPSGAERVPLIASARAGNVIGGGDWALDRLVPDSMRALSAGQPVRIRNPDSIRPWQHVLEPLRGYLLLAYRLYQEGSKFCGGWNFGPYAHDSLPVRDVVTLITKHWGNGRWEDVSPKTQSDPGEAKTLRLDCTKAITELGWRPANTLNDSIRDTVDWYRAYYQDAAADPSDLIHQQIHRYLQRTFEANNA